MTLEWTPWCGTLIAYPEKYHEFSIRVIDSERAMWSYTGPRASCTGFADGLDEAQEICEALYRGMRGGG